MVGIFILFALVMSIGVNFADKIIDMHEDNRAATVTEDGTPGT